MADRAGRVFRRAVWEDLPAVREMYRGIVRWMDANGIRIWDDVYPCHALEEDVRRGRLHLLLDEGSPAAAFALCGDHPGEAHIEWADPRGGALYLTRKGVQSLPADMNMYELSPKLCAFYSSMLEKAGETARELGAAYLRLFVVDVNLPAIRLYARGGFARRKGVYRQEIDTALVLREYGYEKELGKG